MTLSSAGFLFGLLLGLPTEAEAKSSCRGVTMGQLTARAAPGILVLGERPGVIGDAKKAKALVKRLAKTGPVTLGVEFVEARRQSVLDKLALGRVSFEALDIALAFQDDGYTFSVYRRLLALPSKVEGVTLVGLGTPLLVRPEDTPVALPPGYTMVLTDAMGDSPVPPELEGRTVQMVAYHDQRIAKQAVDSWTGEGWLVLLVDRTWVQGGLGVAWQLRRLTDARVDAVLLADPKADCYPDDLLLK
ncbi:MAG: hypothetical protein AAF602_16165 [Myxococcota bacterium]